jgi:aspartate/methionine/tyrosine aminotransferase
MFVPAGTYNVTVVEPGYKAYSNVIAVSNGSASTINFYLEQSHVPVPEFPSGIVQALAVVAMSAALIAMRRKRRRVP